MQIFLFLFIILYKNVFLLYIYNSSLVLNYLNSIKSNETELKKILHHLSQTFTEVYAYNEISKNPPQPLYDNKYYNSVDIQNLLNKINITNISFYKFYQEIIKQISEFKDLHIDIYFNNNNIYNLIKDLYFICPIKFVIKKNNNNNNNEYKIYGKINKYYHYYNKKIIDLIQNNYNNNIYIKSINNLNPFDFIENFCGNIGKTKNPHGTFTYKFNAHYGYNLAVYPLDYNDLNLNIIYENDIKINLEYFFVSTYEINELNYINNKKKFDGDIDKNENNIINNNNNILFNEFLNKKKYEEKMHKKLGKLQKEFNKYMNISEKNKKIKNKELKWDYKYDNETNNIFKCKVDEINKLNIYFIQSFANDDNNHSLLKELFINCVKLFDKNKYPIIVILNNNNGGYADLSKLMIELISPFISINKIISTKINYNKASNNYDINDIIKVNYGKNLSTYLINPVEDLIWLNEEIIKYKKNLVNKRKPTDIIIFTDGYSFSAAATFIKYIQYYGGAIITGFFGNPILINKKIFDSGQSSSSIFQNDSLYFLCNSYKFLSDEYNISMNLPGNQNFFDEMKLNEPLEYIVTPVDERIDIFHNFKNDYYDLFINEALKILDKYKYKCNPNNKKLLNMNKKCNEKIGDNYIFGGYECGNDGIWTNKCVYTFCDIEYIFDYKLKKCIKRKKEFNSRKIIRICLILICIINIYMIISFLSKNKGDGDESQSEGEELIDIPEHN